MGVKDWYDNVIHVDLLNIQNRARVEELVNNEYDYNQNV